MVFVSRRLMSITGDTWILRNPGDEYLAKEEFVSVSRMVLLVEGILKIEPQRIKVRLQPKRGWALKNIDTTKLQQFAFSKNEARNQWRRDNWTARQQAQIRARVEAEASAEAEARDDEETMRAIREAQIESDEGNTGRHSTADLAK